MYQYYMQEGEESPLFLFKSELGYNFQVSFTNYPIELPGVESIFSVSVDCIDNDNPKSDDRVGETICEIINNFLSENKKCLITYVCDTSDNRHGARQRKFYNWYLKFNQTESHVLRKYDVDPKGIDTTYYTSAIFCDESFSNEFIDDIYISYIQEINDYKE